MKNETPVLPEQTVTKQETSSGVFQEIYRQKKANEINPANVNPYKLAVVSWLCFLVGFIIPAIGFFIWILGKEGHPQEAKYAGIGTILGVLAIVIWRIISLSYQIY